MARPKMATVKGRPLAAPDQDEVESLDAAAAELKAHAPGVTNAQAVASAVISRWIIERMKRHSGKRLNETVVFNLNDAKLEGMVEAALPKIGEALAAAEFPFDKSFNDLTKEDAVTLFLVGCVAHREVAVAAGEAPDFPFDTPFNDTVPFGDAAPWETSA